MTKETQNETVIAVNVRSVESVQGSQQFEVHRLEKRLKPRKLQFEKFSA